MIQNYGAKKDIFLLLYLWGFFFCHLYIIALGCWNSDSCYSDYFWYLIQNEIRKKKSEIRTDSSDKIFTRRCTRRVSVYQSHNLVWGYWDIKHITRVQNRPRPEIVIGTKEISTLKCALLKTLRQALMFLFHWRWGSWILGCASAD